MLVAFSSPFRVYGWYTGGEKGWQIDKRASGL